MLLAKFYRFIALIALFGGASFCVSCKTLGHSGSASNVSEGGKQITIVESREKPFSSVSLSSRREKPQKREVTDIQNTDRAGNHESEEIAGKVVDSNSGKQIERDVLPPVEPVRLKNVKSPLIAEKGRGEDVQPTTPPLTPLPSPGLKSPVVSAVNKPKQPADPDQIIVNGNNTNRIIIAGGRNVLVKGSEGVIVISGGCGKLILEGSRNQVQCDSADDVNVTGDNNTLILGIIGNGSISGDENILSWGTGAGGSEPIVQASGASNQMKRLE